jgi:phenylacetate-coenzyme A ligase PaaK-like adenylate-forming protein
VLAITRRRWQDDAVDMTDTTPACSPVHATDALGVHFAVRRHRRAARERLVELQNTRLRRLITHGSEAVPYHRAHFQGQGVRAEHIRTTADLAGVRVTS